MTPSAQTAGGRRVTRWTREKIIEKLREWEARYGEPPNSADWNPSLARWRAQEWRTERYREGVWPSTNAAKRPFGGSFDAAVRAAGFEPRRPGPARRAAGSSRPAVDERRPAVEQAATERDRAEAAERARAAVLDEPEPAVGGDLLERAARLIADADARVRAAEDQAEAAVRDAAEARRETAAADRRARELGALVANGSRRLTGGELATLRDGAPSGPAVLAKALRRLAKARAAGDRGGLAAALGEVASAAVRWRDRL
jgi:hypothetical protein